jgi:hypothetical protein
MKELQPQLDSIFRSEPHFRHPGFVVIQQADDTKPHVFAMGPDSEAQFRLTKSDEMARIA